MKVEKKILDACCGSKMFWFDRNDKRVMFIDNRCVEPCVVGKGRNARMFSVAPDIAMDFREMKFSKNTFNLVVFDPPHLIRAGVKSYMAKKYGQLNSKTWREDLRLGFSECFRVLKTGGTLIFKWNECQIPLKEILALTPARPLFGNRGGKAAKTHWIVFTKSPPK